jgi:hypothetical protein
MARRKRVPQPTKQVIYSPPVPETIEQYARLVCQELAEKIDSIYDSPEMRRELAGFLKIIASICTKQLNKREQKSLDKDDAQR